MLNYQDFFQTLTHHQPYPWQNQFAQWDGNQIAVVNLYHFDKLVLHNDPPFAPLSKGGWGDLL